LTRNSQDLFPGSLQDYIQIFRKRKILILAGTLFAAWLGFTTIRLQSQFGAATVESASEVAIMIRTPCAPSPELDVTNVVKGITYDSVLNSIVALPLFAKTLERTDANTSASVRYVRYREGIPLEDFSHALEMTVGFKASTANRDRVVSVVLDTLNKIHQPYLTWVRRRLSELGASGNRMLAQDCLKFAAWQHPQLAPDSLATFRNDVTAKPFKKVRAPLAAALSLVSGFMAMLVLALGIELFQRSRTKA
jgi:hypothetical protein